MDECNRSWCSSSNANDQRAVTIECASDKTEPYAFNSTVYNKLIELCADICRRNDKNKLVWISDKNKALAYNPAANEMLLTVHRWFANKSCPGDWMFDRMGDLAQKVNEKLGSAGGIDKFYPVGIPRTDIFFDEDYKKKTCERVYAEFPGAKEAKRVILYAPTFRGNSAVDAHFPMEKLDFEEWGELCKRTDSYLIVKMHPFVQEKINIPEKYRDCIADAAQYREVNDILFITDLLITDYSSIIYEFSLLRRPMLFYAFDQIMYVSTRDFYEPYEDIVPGRIIKRFDQLMEALEKEEYDTDKIEWFIKKNFAYTDGKSTDRVIDLIVGDDKEIKKYSAASMQGALAAVSNNFGMNGEHVDKRYRDDDRSVVQNRGEAQEKDSESQNNDKYSE